MPNSILCLIHHRWKVLAHRIDAENPTAHGAYNDNYCVTRLWECERCGKLYGEVQRGMKHRISPELAARICQGEDTDNA